MKYLILFLISTNLGADCLPKNDGISCINKPCVNEVREMIGAIVTGSCNKVYKKVKGEWVYDYTLVNILGQSGMRVFRFENRIYDIGKE